MLIPPAYLKPDLFARFFLQKPIDPIQCEIFTLCPLDLHEDIVNPDIRLLSRTVFYVIPYRILIKLLAKSKKDHTTPVHGKRDLLCFIRPDHHLALVVIKINIKPA